MAHFIKFDFRSVAVITGVVTLEVYLFILLKEEEFVIFFLKNYLNCFHKIGTSSSRQIIFTVILNRAAKLCCYRTIKITLMTEFGCTTNLRTNIQVVLF